jgi:hypothetical protein
LKTFSCFVAGRKEGRGYRTAEGAALQRRVDAALAQTPSEFAAAAAVALAS